MLRVPHLKRVSHGRKYGRSFEEIKVTSRERHPYRKYDTIEVRSNFLTNSDTKNIRKNCLLYKRLKVSSVIKRRKDYCKTRGQKEISGRLFIVIVSVVSPVNRYVNLVFGPLPFIFRFTKG